MERSAGADGSPQPTTFPACRWIVDAAIHPLRVEADGIRNSEHYPLTILKCKQRLRGISGIDRSVFPQAEGIELIKPCVVDGFGSTGIRRDIGLGYRFGINRMTFRTV